MNTCRSPRAIFAENEPLECGQPSNYRKFLASSQKLETKIRNRQNLNNWCTSKSRPIMSRVAISLLDFSLARLLVFIFLFHKFFLFRFEIPSQIELQYVNEHWIIQQITYFTIERHSREVRSESEKERIQHIHLSYHEHGATRFYSSSSRNTDYV